MRNYDIYLPTHYNDGTPIPQMTLDTIRGKVINRFGGATILAESSGSWHHNGETRTEGMRILRVICEDNKGNAKYIESFKATLEARLGQEEIFIVTWEVQTVSRRFPNSVENFNRRC